jgi:hypothetical protein
MWARSIAVGENLNLYGIFCMNRGTGHFATGGEKKKISSDTEGATVIRFRKKLRFLAKHRHFWWKNWQFFMKKLKKRSFFQKF